MAHYGTLTRTAASVACAGDPRRTTVAVAILARTPASIGVGGLGLNSG